MKVKITLVKFKSECLVCRFFGACHNSLIQVARERFSNEMWVCLNLIKGKKISFISLVF